MTLTTKQTIAILLMILIGLVLYFPERISVSHDDFYAIAICLAAFLPAGSFKIASLKPQLTLSLILVISFVMGGLWYFIIQKIYPSSALIFSVMVSCGSYLMFRMK